MKKYISAGFAALLTVGLVSSVFAANPQFNNLQGDRELFTGRNITKGQTDLSDPTQGDVGDQLEGVIYYHNTQENSTASNVHVAVSGIDETVSNTHVLHASIAADNATSATDTIVNGQVVGKSGWTINLSQAAALQIVPGSVRWFPNGAQDAQALPNGQTGAELFTAQGLSLGDIQGCWAHAGYVMFRVKTTVVGVPNIEKSKSAFNETQNIDATKVTAKPSDRITYTLTTKNTGTETQNGFVVEDGIRDILDYADVVAISDNGQKIDNASAANRDDQVKVVYPAVDIAAGQTVTRTFTVVVMNPIPTTAQVGNAYDFTMFNFYGNAVVITIEHPTNAQISIVKLVRNVTKNEAQFATTNTANPGNTLEYQVTVKNAGNKVINVNLKDILPNGVTVDKTSIVAKNGATGAQVSGDMFADGMTLQNVGQNAEIIVTFKATTLGTLADNTNLCNKAVATFEGQSKESSACTVIMVVPTTPAVHTPSPTQSSLPSSGANPFGILVTVIGFGYAAYSRYTAKKTARLLDETI